MPQNGEPQHKMHAYGQLLILPICWVAVLEAPRKGFTVHRKEDDICDFRFQ